MATAQESACPAEPPGGVITALATAYDAEGNVQVFAGSGAGLLVSLDGGQSWESRGRGRIPLVTAIAPSAGFAEDSTLFLGTMDGCHYSSDAGRTSGVVLTGGHVLAVTTIPLHPESTDLHTTALVFAGTEWDGIYRSDDGGRRWGTVNAGLLDLTVLDIALSPAFTQDKIGFAATSTGLYRTTNGGKAWKWAELEVDGPAVQCLALSPNFAVDGLAFAGTEDNGLYCSRDAGATWKRISSVSGQSVTAVAIAPEARAIAAATDDGVVVSFDGGATWERRGQELGSVLCLCFLIHQGRDVLLAGTVGTGIARSENLGLDWRHQAELMELSTESEANPLPRL